VACPGDPPHAGQLVLKDILELPRFAEIIIKAKYERITELESDGVIRDVFKVLSI
jgi:hypothetical protein